MSRDVRVLLTGVATGIGVTVLAAWILDAVPTAPSAWAVVRGAWLSGADYVEGARVPVVGAALLLSVLLVVGGDRDEGAAHGARHPGWCRARGNRHVRTGCRPVASWRW